MPETAFGIEALEMALHLEKIGRSFYEHMANAGNGTGALYRDLASQEHEHEKVLAYALDYVAASEKPSLYPWDYYQYIRSVADRVVSLDGVIQEAMAQGTISDEKASDICQALERESIFVYSSMYSVVPVTGKDVCQRLAADEAAHLQLLQKMALEQYLENTPFSQSPLLLAAGNRPQLLIAGP